LIELVEHTVAVRESCPDVDFVPRIVRPVFANQNSVRDELDDGSD
jgi:hypothetical protein